VTFVAMTDLQKYYLSEYGNTTQIVQSGRWLIAS
jgi:hypothetical protein